MNKLITIAVTVLRGTMTALKLPLGAGGGPDDRLRWRRKEAAQQIGLASPTEWQLA